MLFIKIINLNVFFWLSLRFTIYFSLDDCFGIKVAELWTLGFKRRENAFQLLTKIFFDAALVIW